MIYSYWFRGGSGLPFFYILKNAVNPHPRYIGVCSRNISDIWQNQYLN